MAEEGFSQVKFYNVGFKEEDNAFIDEDLVYYLDRHLISTIDNFQYVRNDKEIEIKINKSQIQLERTMNLPTLETPIGNYVSIQNIDMFSERNYQNIIFYYFITKKTQKSPETIRLTLKLDILNTFPVGEGNNALYKFSPKTIINRQHKNRFLDPTTYPPIVIDGNPHFRRNIDRTSEAQNNEMLKTFEEDIVESNSGNWYIMYESRTAITSETQNFPMDIYFITDDDDLYVPEGTSGTFEVEPSEFIRSAYSSNDYFFFGGKFNNPAVLHSGTITVEVYGGSEESFNIDDGLYVLYVEHNEAWDFKNKLVVNKFRDNGIISTFFVKNLALDSKIKIETSERLAEFYKANFANLDYPDNTVEEDVAWINQNTAGYYELNNPQTSVKLDTFATVDRTNTKLLKIIKLPYAPFNVDINEVSGQRVLSVPVNADVGAVTWDAGDTRHYLRIKPDYTGIYKKVLESDIKPYEDLFSVVDAGDRRNDDNESKLFHSDFDFKKIVYDSFGYVIKNEELDPREIDMDDTLDINYIVSASITSRFMFDFTELEKQIKTEDYSDILSIARNNEVQLYNSNYLNYIRNGYNYDVKNKNQAISASAVGLGIGAVGSLLAGNFVGAGLSLAGGAVSTINNISQSETSIEGKLAQLKAQAISVSGSDDVDLLTYYSHNRAKVCHYVANPKTMSNNANMFYYFGYASNELGAPALKTRKWFNYIQANVKLVNVNKEVIPYLSDIIRLWNNGVTIYHNGGARYNPEYDFAQTTANNELFIEEYLHPAENAQ